MRPFRPSILLQILVPIIAIQGAAIALIATSTALLATRRSEHQIISRLNNVIESLSSAGFPFTNSVLNRMRGLSGAHFIAATPDGQVSASTLPEIHALPSSLASRPPTTRVHSLETSNSTIIHGTTYFTASVRPASLSPHAPALLVLYPEVNWRQARSEAILPPLLLGAAALATMTLATGYIAHRISTRLERLQRQVARIAEGDFHQLHLGPTHDEVDHLSHSINSMSSQLQTMQHTIRQSERTRLLAQLAAGLAHQLRNSLTGARMSVQLHARRHPVDDGDQSLDVAIRQLAMTEEQVKGILALGRAERRPPELCDARDLLAEVATMLNPSCHHAKVNLVHHAAPQPQTFIADRSSVRAALLNLALNAIEAAGQGGAVHLESSETTDEVALTVADSGGGPSPEIAASLGEPFVTTKPEGVGLGLAIAHQVAAEHGGQLTWSRTANHETRFELRLPRTSTHHVPTLARSIA